MAHCNEIERRARLGKRLFCLIHPRVYSHYYRKGLIDSLLWQNWLLRHWGEPAEHALELSCGNGPALALFLQNGFLRNGVGLDLDESRFTSGGAARRVSFLAGDVNRIKLPPNHYDLSYAL